MKYSNTKQENYYDTYMLKEILQVNLSFLKLEMKRYRFPKSSYVKYQNKHLFTETAIIDFIDYRKQIKSPIKTIAPIKLYIKTLRELQKLGYKIQEVIDLQKSKEWQSIKVEWVVKELGKKEDTSLLPTRDIGGYSF